MKPLREYQKRAIRLTSERIRAGDKKVLIFMATGSGKSVVFNEMIRSTIQKGFKALFIVRRRELIFQAANKHFKQMGLNVSIVMGNEKGFNPKYNLQVCSIDTLQRRIHNEKYEFLKGFDYVYLDEAHDCTSEKYKKVLSELNFKACIGFTASPFMVGNKVHDFWDSCVKPVEIKSLINDGFLTESRIYAPKKIDLSGLKKMAGDYHIGDLFEIMSDMSVIGDVINTYKKYGENKPAILFCVNINHSILMTEAFNRAGIKTTHCDQSTDKKDRDKAIRNLETGKIKILSSVNIFSTGCDISGVECVIMARATMSEILYIQQIGRGLRPYSICGRCSADYVGNGDCYYCGHDNPKYRKKYCIILDHGNNVDRHGLPDKPREAVLVAKKKEKKKHSIGQEVHIKQCPECFLYAPRPAQKCDGCGYEYKTEERMFKEEDGELVLLDDKMYRAKMGEKIEARWAYHSKQMRYKTMDNNYAFEKIYEDFGVEVLKFIKFPKHLENILRKKTILGNASKVFK